MMGCYCVLQWSLKFFILTLILASVFCSGRQEEYENDPRCTPIKYILRYWEEYQSISPMAYVVMSDSEFPEERVDTIPMFFDNDTKRCISKLTFPCANNSDCGEGAICNNKGIWSTQFYGDPDSLRKIDPEKNPLIGICTCPSDKVKNAKITACLVGAEFGKSCNEGKPCIGANVECLDNKCACPPRRAVSRVDTESGSNTTYYYDVNKDRPYEGNPRDIIQFPRRYSEKEKRCLLMEPTHPCLDTTDCGITKSCSSSWSNGFGTWEGGSDDYRFESRHVLLGRCGCYGGDSPATLDPVTDECVPSPKYGEFCSATLPCYPDVLTCKNNRCECPEEGHKYNDQKRGCVAPIGTKCRDGYGECEENAECFLSNYRESHGVCKCKQEFLEVNGTCYAKYMSQCYSDTKCNPAGFLKCVDGYCKCGDLVNQVYDSDNLKCRALVGSKCSGIGPQCVENANCDTSGVCRCRSGLMAKTDGTCGRMMDVGSPCSYYANDCNAGDGWACVDGKCKCVDDNLKVMDGKCLATTGSICGAVALIGKKSTKPENDKFYYVGCDDEGICDAPVGGKAKCKRAYAG